MVCLFVSSKGMSKSIIDLLERSLQLKDVDDSTTLLHGTWAIIHSVQ